MKIGAILSVNCDKENIKYCLEGIYDFCDKIVIVYSDTSWAGVKQEDETVNILDTFPDPQNKLEIVKGSYPIQVNHRNTSLKTLRKFNCDYVFIIDSDEIYAPETLKKVRSYIKQHPNRTAFKVRFFQLWKTLQYTLIPHREVIVFFKMTPDFRFVGPGREAQYRQPKKHRTDNELIPEVDCFHLTAVCTNEYMKQKITTRSYKTVVKPKWYENVWLKWNPDMENLHPTKPDVYKKAILLTVKLPIHLKTHRFYR